MADIDTTNTPDLETPEEPAETLSNIRIPYLAVKEILDKLNPSKAS
jgi:hypothetical protein